MISFMAVLDRRQMTLHDSGKGTGPSCAKPGTNRRLVAGLSGKRDLSPLPALPGPILSYPPHPSGSRGPGELSTGKGPRPKAGNPPPMEAAGRLSPGTMVKRTCEGYPGEAAFDSQRGPLAIGLRTPAAVPRVKETARWQ